MIGAWAIAFLRDLAGAALFESWGSAGVAAVLVAGSWAVGLLVIPATVARPALRALAGFPLALLAGGTVGILLYLLNIPVRGGLGAAVLGAALCFGIGLRHRIFRGLGTRREILLLGFLLIVGYTLAFFGWGETTDGTIRGISGVWGDGPLHTLIMEAFVHRTGGDLSMPAFAGEQLREPFGTDFVAAMLRSAGFTVGGAFTVPAAGLLACLLGWAGHLAARFAAQDGASKASVRLAAASATVLVCSFGGLQWLVMATRAGAWSPARFFGVHASAWDKAEDLGLIWANHLNMFASQKHLLLAAAFLLVLAALLLERMRPIRRIGPIGPTERVRLLLPFAIATGFLPLFHTHAFLAAGLLWLAAALITRSRSVTAIGALALVTALPTLLWQFGLASRAGFLTLRLGWMASDGVRGWLWFWFFNLGIFLPLLGLAVWRGGRQQRRAVTLLGVPALLLFVAANVVQFQPYQWDNFKLFLFAWLLVLPLVAAEMSRWRFRGTRAVTISLLVLMSLTTLSEFPTHLNFRATHPVYDARTRAAARHLDAILPRAAVVLADTDTVHNHPLTLTGRTLFMGYGGWIWTRAYQASERSALLTRLRALHPHDVCTHATLLGITHVIRREAAGQFLVDVC